MDEPDETSGATTGQDNGAWVTQMTSSVELGKLLKVIDFACFAD